jgi:hypothetical protein
VSTRFIIGDVREVLATLPAGSVDCVITSPPFLALRSYLPADHPDKAKEIGSEPTPAEFIDALLDVTEALDRVLAPHGSLCIELADTYSGSGGAGGDYAAGGLREGQPGFKQRPLSPRPKYQGLANGDGHRSRSADEAAGILQPRHRGGPGQRDAIPGYPLDKSLAMIPESFRWALAYGRNPFNGRETPPWRVRNVIRHFRPNPPVGALGDKVRPATSEWVAATKSRTRFFDLEAVRGPGSENTHARTARGVESRPSTGKVTDDERRGGNFSTLDTLHSTGGAPPLDWWSEDDLEWKDATGFVQPTHGYTGSHFATFSPKVVARLLLPICPERVCVECGEPSRRIVETTDSIGKASRRNRDMADRADGPVSSTYFPDRAARLTLGWTDCGHGGGWRPGVVLDPFAGSGTTLMVALGHGRDSIGIDLDSRNADLAGERCGMFLSVEYPTAEVIA